MYACRKLRVLGRQENHCFREEGGFRRRQEAVGLWQKERVLNPEGKEVPERCGSKGSFTCIPAVRQIKATMHRQAQVYFLV